MATTIDHIFAEFRDDARSNRDLGDRFERLIQAFLLKDPVYADLFSDVWLWMEWPDRNNKPDTGIDLVARERATGEYWAIQAKFFDPDVVLQKHDIDSFFTASGKKPFSRRMVVSTSNSWSKHAEEALENQHVDVKRLKVSDLRESSIDWSQFSFKNVAKLKLKPKHKLRDHQKKALNDVVDGLAEADRGKLIMACGTGKTFTALKIAEKIAPGGNVLFLVPSLSLMSQSLREWCAEAEPGIAPLAVCSDANVGKSRKKPSEDSAEISLHDLVYPATTSDKKLVKQYKHLADFAKEEGRMLVVFSTYQSIEAVSKAQKSGLPEFDLIICDEAHRTTGVKLAGEDESHFVKVHDAKFIKAKKRLYMTATPRIYGDAAKTKAKDASAELASMDDPTLFGEELHRLGFGEAVGKSLLSDYKVLVLAVDEKYVAKTFQKQIADKNNELNLDDAVKITGCWNGLEKKFNSTTDATDLQGDTQPMRRAVAFSRSIKDSKAFVQKFHQIVAAYKETHPDEGNLLEVEADHVDGTYNAISRGVLLDWLKADADGNTCRVLSNARCLSEGVDVPALDAVMFLNPRNSVIDVVQSVGRVMRRAEGKQYGYIILPIGIPGDMKPEDALKDNEKYKVVWQVLQALRAHDDRFNATINQLELNEKRPDNIQVIGVGSGSDDEQVGGDGDSKPKVREVQGALAFPDLDDWKDAIYAKIVLKCGQREYWEHWAAEVAGIAERHITRIKALLDDPAAPHTKAFDEFLTGLQANLNPAVTRDDAIEMLAQHLITKPVFDALFGNYAFTQHNPVSQSMEKMLELLHEQAVEKEVETLEKFYDSVRRKVQGIDNAEARQTIIRTLYDEFFRTAFPRMAERLGIVYTPVEVVDFIINSVEDILRDEFNSGLGEEDVHIIDPFTGTGTFIVRLLQSGLISPEKLAHKYKHELHANEIVLLAYYIAAINIEETYHGLRTQTSSAPSPGQSPETLAGEGRGEGSSADYEPFEGIVLTDTFQLYEPRGEIIEKAFPENNKRVKKQKASPIRVVIANPPYSANQGDANNNNQNLKYPHLDARIANTYAARSTATNKNSLYDSYVRAIRWASDRIESRGIVGFVTNGYFIDGNAMDGLRACLKEEFQSIHVFNLRGNQRTSGEVSKQEGGKIFGSGARTPVAITLLVKNPEKTEQCTLNYHDIGDYQSREEKLALIKAFASVSGIKRAGKWTALRPNVQHDWINQRDEAFEEFVPIGDKSGDNIDAVFSVYSRGLETSRDAWCYNFSVDSLAKHIGQMISFYNSQVDGFQEVSSGKAKAELAVLAKNYIETDQKKIAWSSSLIDRMVRGRKATFQRDAIVSASYRAFCKLNVYKNDEVIHRMGQMASMFPTVMPNIAICTTSAGNRGDYSAFISSTIPDLNYCGAASVCQAFPLYIYEKAEKSEEFDFDDTEVVDGYHRRDAITDAILTMFQSAYDNTITKEDIFYYVYGILHSPEYRTRFAADLKKMLPRIPLTKETDDFWKFSQAGRDLAQWHLNYETVEPWPVKELKDSLLLNPEEDFVVQKMTFARPTAEQKAAGQKWDKSRIIYNSKITLAEIPLEAYDYVVNGKPAIEWIIERYQFTRDKDSGITNDPNDWCREHNEPRYIIDLVKRIVRVSIETMKIVNSLPALNER